MRSTKSFINFKQLFFEQEYNIVSFIPFLQIKPGCGVFPVKSQQERLNQVYFTYGG